MCTKSQALCHHRTPSDAHWGKAMTKTKACSYTHWRDLSHWWQRKKNILVFPAWCLSVAFQVGWPLWFPKCRKRECMICAFSCSLRLVAIMAYLFLSNNLSISYSLLRPHKSLMLLIQNMPLHLFYRCPKSSLQLCIAVYSIIFVKTNCVSKIWVVQ